MRIKFLFFMLFCIKLPIDILFSQNNYHPPEYMFNQWDKTFMRIEPDIKSNPIEVIPQGKIVELTGKTSDKLFTVIVNNIKYTEPYINIKLPESKKNGWIYKPSLAKQEVINFNSDIYYKSKPVIPAIEKRYVKTNIKNPFKNIDCKNNKNENYCFFQKNKIVT